MQSRTQILLYLILYLAGLTIFLSYAGSTFGDIGVTESEQTFIGSTFLFNIITGVSILPVPLTLLFFTIPLALLGYLLFTAIFPTGNAGA